MALPIRTTLADIRDVCRYFATKPTGATVQEAKAVLDPKKLDGRKVSALKYWGLLEEHEDGRHKLTSNGRALSKGDNEERAVLLEVVREIPAYNAIIERAAHRHEDSLDTAEVGAHWHDHFKDEAADSDKILKDQAVCFFHIAEGASLGKLIAGRNGKSTRLSFLADALKSYVSLKNPNVGIGNAETTDTGEEPPSADRRSDESASPPAERRPSHEGGLGSGIFIAHGKNKKPMEQLKKILEQFHIPYKVAVEEPNLGRPISGKIREIMHACNCAILIFTADEEFQQKDGETIWRPSENVVYELGAAGYLYDRRIVILKEDKVTFPSNFSDLGYISFDADQLEAKTMDVLKELIGFGIVRIST